MKKYIIKWSCGYGSMHDVIEADNEDEADKTAYGAWLDDAESNADYEAIEWTQELEDELR